MRNIRVAYGTGAGGDSTRAGRDNDVMCELGRTEDESGKRGLATGHAGEDVEQDDRATLRERKRITPSTARITSDRTESKALLK